MKRYLLFLFLACSLFVGIPILGNAQTYLNFTANQAPLLVANAGNDTIACTVDSVDIGGLVPATGGTSPFSYAWSPTTGLSDPTVANPTGRVSLPDTVVYTLTVTDANGCTAADNFTFVSLICSGLEDALGIQGMDVYPNPSEGQFNITVSLKESFSKATLRILDVQGKEVWNRTRLQPTANWTESVGLNTLPRGIYTVELDADGQKVSRKIVLQ